MLCFELFVVVDTLLYILQHSNGEILQFGCSRRHTLLPEMVLWEHKIDKHKNNKIELYRYIHTCTYVCMRTCIHAYGQYTHAYVHAYMHTCSIHMHMYVHVYMHTGSTHIHSYMQYTHAYMQCSPVIMHMYRHSQRHDNTR